MSTIQSETESKQTLKKKGEFTELTQNKTFPQKEIRLTICHQALSEP